MKDLFIIFAVALVVAVAFETCDVFNDDKSHACPMDACDADKPKYQGKVVPDSTAIMRYTLGEFLIYDEHGNSLKVKSNGQRWEVESGLPIRIMLQDGFIESADDSIAIGFEYNFKQRTRIVFPDAEFQP